MTQVEFSRLLSDLAETAKVLNERSDAVNDIIKRFQDTLRSMNVGLEVWPVTLSTETWTDTIVDEETGEERQYQRGLLDHELGFTKTPEGWILATRNAYYDPEYHGSGKLNPDGEEVMVPMRDTRERLIRADEITPLLEESRSTRIEALTHFPAIAQELKLAADRAITAIDTAKTFLK